MLVFYQAGSSDMGSVLAGSSPGLAGMPWGSQLPQGFQPHGTHGRIMESEMSGLKKTCWMASKSPFS